MRAVSQRRATPSQDLLQQALIALFFGLSAFFLSLILWFLTFQVWYMGRIFPGVTVAGVEVSGLNPDEAAATIASELTYPHNGHILFSDEGKTWVVKPVELGLALDAQTSATNAFKYGRSGGLLRRIDDQISTRQFGIELPPVMILDQRLTFEYLSRLAKEIDKPQIEPAISINGTEVTITQGQVGRTVDIPATINSLTRQMQPLRDAIVPLVVTEKHPTIKDVESQAELARTILREPTVLNLPAGQEGAGPWVIEPAELASMLEFDLINDGETATYQLNLSEEKLRAYLSGMASQMQTEAADARFVFNDDTRQLDLIADSQIGRKLDLENSIKSIQQGALSGQHAMALELVLTPPRVSSDMTGEELGITELIHSETSYYYGSSEDRIQNIQAASGSFHGVLVAPGETFSMATALGDISLDNGYAEALIIYGDQTIMGIGGGVCQVSTTLFRTAFFSGFPVVERHAHAYRVSYYEKTADNNINPRLAGLDASVFVPLVDMKFVNDSPYWLLMETYVNPTYRTLIWKFYSTSDGRSVQWDTTGLTNVVPAPKPIYKENPELPTGEVKQVDWAADGADITVSRSVFRGDELLFSDSFNTSYQPWQAKYEYGPGTEGMPPPEENE